MVKNKIFMVIVAIFVLSAVLLIGCSAGTGGETVLDEKPAIPDSTAPADKEEADESQATATASGTLKAINAVDGTVTITTESGDELALKITGESKIFVSESLSTLVKLDAVIGSKVSVEYHAETKTVAVIYIQD